MDVKSPPAMQHRHVSIRIEPESGALRAAFDSLVIVREVCAPKSEFVNAPLEHLVIYLTESGDAEAKMSGRSLAHRPGSLMLLTPGLTLHERIGAAPWSVGYIMLSGGWAAHLAGLVEEREPGGSVYSPSPPAWQRQFREMLDIGFEQAAGWEWRFLSACAALFGSIARYPPSEEGADRLLDEVDRLLNSDPYRCWTRDTLATALGLTQRQLTYRFEKAVGCAPALWLRRRRVAAARRLLSEGHSVAKTAETLGFANPYHFSRLFKSITGAPPSEMRRTPGLERTTDING